MKNIKILISAMLVVSFLIAFTKILLAILSIMQSGYSFYFFIRDLSISTVVIVISAIVFAYIDTIVIRFIEGLYCKYNKNKAQVILYLMEEYKESFETGICHFLEVLGVKKIIHTRTAYVLERFVMNNPPNSESEHCTNGAMWYESGLYEPRIEHLKHLSDLYKKYSKYKYYV